MLGVISKAIDPRAIGATGDVMTFAIPADKIREHFSRYINEK